MYRIGNGYDIHRLEADRRLILCGVEIPHECGLAGHSDADAVLHAVIDAILGAAGMGDIGEFFPDDDPAYANADSTELLTKAIAMVKEKGFCIVNCDVTIVAEKPKLSAYKVQMRTKLAELLAVAPECASVKAKTNEGLDATGQGRAIAVFASVLMKTE